MSTDLLKDNKALQNVINTLKFHQTNTENRQLVQYIEKQNPSFVNDYIKVFKESLNGNLNDNSKNFEAIHNLLIQSLDQIDIKTCPSLKRFYDEDYYMKITDKTARFYCDLLDSLYVYFVHSYDLGYKTKGKIYTNDSDEKNINDSDIEITKLKSYLNNKQSQLKDIIPNYLNENKDNDDLKQNYDHFEYYSYGTRYNYWSRGTDEMYTNKKYKNLKDELLNNKVYGFSMELLKYVWNKATMLLTADEFKKIEANKLHGDDWFITGGEAMELTHIIAILICCDVPKAYNAFKGVICGDAEEKEEKELNYEIYEFSRLIREAIECFGTALSDCKYDLFYYAINTLDSLLFGEYMARFNHPMMVTSSIESALISTDNGNGYILELLQHDSRLTYFDVSWFGAYMMKEELLFCGGALPLRIVNIRQVALDKNYKTFVSALSVLDTIISGERPNERPSKYDLDLIKKILNKDNGEFSEYIKNLFEYYVICVKRVNINFYFFNDYYQDLIGMLASNEPKNTILIGNVIGYFPDCEYIGIEGGPKGIDANETYLAALLGIVEKLEKGNELKQIELKNAKFQEAVVFDTFMESFFNAGFDINMEKKLYDVSLMFKAVEED